MATENKKDRFTHATEMAEYWQYRGNVASERGKSYLAERHYSRSQKWRDEMKEILENGKQK